MKRSSFFSFLMLLFIYSTSTEQGIAPTDNDKTKSNELDSCGKKVLVNAEKCETLRHSPDQFDESGRRVESDILLKTLFANEELQKDDRITGPENTSSAGNLSHHCMRTPTIDHI